MVENIIKIYQLLYSELPINISMIFKVNGDLMMQTIFLFSRMRGSTNFSSKTNISD